jgi:hypothetical protein
VKTILLMALVPLLLAQGALAKDKEYLSGTLNKVPLHIGNKRTTGFSDTTNCTPGLAAVHCTGGIVDDYRGKLVADMPDGSVLVIRDCVGGATAAAFFLSCDQTWVFVLTEEDGTQTFLQRVQFGSGEDKFGDKFGDSAKILYTVEHHGGVTYIVIPDPTNAQKNGKYTRMKLPKSANKIAPLPAGDNVAAMCGSGKLTPEQQAKFCSKQEK